MSKTDPVVSSFVEAILCRYGPMNVITKGKLAVFIDFC